MIEPREKILLRRMRDDIKMVFEQDPAARSTLEVVTTYGITCGMESFDSP